MIVLFVYGTLAPGELSWSLLAPHAVATCEGSVPGRLYDTGRGYPGAVFAPGRDLAWTSVTGVDQHGRWRLRPLRDGRTRVELRLQYGIAGGGIWSWLAEQLAGPTVRGHARKTLTQLKRTVEHEQARAAAAERRAART